MSLYAPEPNLIRVVHCQCEHPCIKCRFYFVKWIHHLASKADVKVVVRECKEC